MRLSRSHVFCRLLFAGFLFALIPLPAFCQGDEYKPPPRVTIKRTTQLRHEPRKTGTSQQELTTSDELRLVSRRQKGGFYRVINARGQQGWIEASNVRIERPPAEVVSFAVGSCPATLLACPPNGCGLPGTPQAIVNETKRHIPAGSAAIPLTFADFQSLQDQANPLVNQKMPLTQEQRDLIQHLTVSAGSAGEGSLVRTSGFIAFASHPHANSGESVNCRLTGQASNDFHISLAPRATNTEGRGIVIEMIPQDRLPEWTITRLNKAQTQKRRVLVVGQLFYDNLHFVNPDGLSNGDPKRFSLWEVHPVTQLFVCVKAGNSCNPDNLSEWKKLENF